MYVVAVDELETAARMACMAVLLSAWPTLMDEDTKDVGDVLVYSFDDTIALWIKSGDGAKCNAGF